MIVSFEKGAFKIVAAQTHPFVIFLLAKTLHPLPGGNMGFAYCKFINTLTCDIR